MKIEAWLHYCVKKPSLCRLSFNNDLTVLEKNSGWVSIRLEQAREDEYKPHSYVVYVGRATPGGDIVYVGSTSQKPEDRFRWHRANEKDLHFTVVAAFDNADDMVLEEQRLIDINKPVLNKRQKAIHNAPLTQDKLESRKGDKGWCQGCLRRRVNRGYKFCMWCAK